MSANLPEPFFQFSTWGPKPGSTCPRRPNLVIKGEGDRSERQEAFSSKRGISNSSQRWVWIIWRFWVLRIMGGSSVGKTTVRPVREGGAWGPGAGNWWKTGEELSDLGYIQFLSFTTEFCYTVQADLKWSPSFSSLGSCNFRCGSQHPAAT